MEIIDYKALMESRYTDLVRSYPAYDPIMQSLCQIFIDKQEEYKLFAEQMLDLDVSVGRQLDMIGALVGQSRDLELFTTVPYFGFEGGREAQAFGVGTWRSILSPQGGTNRKLTDAEYRIVIRARVESNKSRCTVDSTLRVINILAQNNTSKIENSPDGGTAFIVVVEPNAMLSYFLTQLDREDSIIPTPLGVKVKVSIVEAV